MFSYFDGGIKNTKSTKPLDFPSLIRIIRSNPNADKIDKIRSLRESGNDSYKDLKKQLPYITPNCMVTARNLKGENYNQNFNSFSGYLYFDFDIPNAKDFKDYFIRRYGHLASMICLSSSGGGISVLFKIKNTITKENFDDVWLAVRNQILKDEQVDIICKDIGRAMFVSHDESVYYNYDNEVEVDIESSTTKTIKKEGKQCNSYDFCDNTLNSPFSIIPIDIVLKKLITRTPVEVQNPIVDYVPVEYLKFYIPETIKDGTKHKIYFSMIHALVYLNPDIERDYIFSYMFYINNRFAKPKMEKREFNRLFNTIYNGIKSSGNTVVKTKIKSVHINPDSNLTKKEKISVANHINGIKRKNISIRKIVDAKTELEKRGKKITQKAIRQISGLSPKTVRKHLHSSVIEMDKEIQIVNDSLSTIPIFTGDTSYRNVA